MKLSGREAVFWARNCAGLFLCDVLGSFENDFGNEILGKYVYILVCYVV